MYVRGPCFAVCVCVFAALTGGLGQDASVGLGLKNVGSVPERNEKEINTELSGGQNFRTENKPSSATDSNLPSVHQPVASGIGSNNTQISALLPDRPVSENTIPDLELQNKIPVLDGISVKVLSAEENGIGISDMTLNKQKLLKNESHIKTFSVDYHIKKNLLFFAANDSIYRDEVIGNLLHDGEDSRLIVHKGVDGPVSVAVDWLHDRLYWYSIRHNTVEHSSLDGSNRTLIIDSIQNSLFPNNIAVDPYEGYIFFVSNHSIFRTTLDGNNLTGIPLRRSNGRAVKHLSLDTHRKRIYYTGKDGDYDKGTPYLASSDYEGRQTEEFPLVKILWNDIFGLSVFRNTLYFAHYPKSGADTIWSLDLSEETLNPKLRYEITDPNGGLWSIRVYHPKLQEKVENI